MTTAIIIVSYRTPDDVADCLRAIDELESTEAPGVFVVENGGAEAYNSLVAAAAEVCAAPDGSVPSPFAQPHVPAPVQGRHLRRAVFKLPRSAASVSLAEASENLGYAGGVNSWLEDHAAMAPWTGFWILNPDTAPDSKALAGLIAACQHGGRGMAGSIILDYERRNRIVSRGLRWRPWRCDVFGVDRGRQMLRPLPPPNPEIDAPSGTSMYLTRSCLDRIGLMNEEYFLYYEDLDWGMRAKAFGLLCRADESFVPHKYGSSLGSAERRSQRSLLSVYLDARNTILFTRRHHPKLFLCAVARMLLRAVEYLAVGSARNCSVALSGTRAGIRGETGRPSWMT